MTYHHSQCAIVQEADSQTQAIVTDIVSDGKIRWDVTYLGRSTAIKGSRMMPTGRTAGAEIAMISLMRKNELLVLTDVVSGCVEVSIRNKWLHQPFTVRINGLIQFGQIRAHLMLSDPDDIQEERLCFMNFQRLECLVNCRGIEQIVREADPAVDQVHSFFQPVLCLLTGEPFLLIDDVVKCALYVAYHVFDNCPHLLQMLSLC